MDKKFSLTFNVEIGKHDTYYQAQFDPGDPATRCTISYQFSPFQENGSGGLLQSVGIGVRKEDDIYNRETGCRMALKSALRRIENKTVRAAAWKAYLEKFPVSNRRRRPNFSLTLTEAMQAARKIIREDVLLRNAWPEDEWISLSKGWDLNLSLDDKNNPTAALYLVRDGKTVTNKWYAIKVPSEKSPDLKQYAVVQLINHLSSSPDSPAPKDDNELKGSTLAAMELTVRDLPA